jgi:methionyl-tRNA synthetase
VSGIAAFYQPQELLHLKAIFVLNLVERKIMGLSSQAMILAAKDGEYFSVTTPLNSQVAAGTLLS